MSHRNHMNRKQPQRQPRPGSSSRTRHGGAGDLQRAQKAHSSISHLSIRNFQLTPVRYQFTSNQQPATNKYFTLVELLLVAGLMLLISSVGIIAVSPMLGGSNLDSAASTVQTAVYQARTYAVMNNMATRVHFYTSDSDDPGKIIGTDDTDGNRIMEPYFIPVGVDFGDDFGDDFDGVESTSDVSGAFYFGLTPTGSVDGGYSITIPVTNKQKDRTKKIEVKHTTGMIRITDE